MSLLTDGYTQLSGPAAESPTAARDFLQRLIADAETSRGYVFLSDQDNGGRSGPDSSGGIHGLDYRSSQWDNGMDPATALEHALDVRRRALDTLDESTLQPFQPYSRLRDLLPPVYMWHRYEVNSDAFSICRAVRLANPKSITIAGRGRCQNSGRRRVSA